MHSGKRTCHPFRRNIKRCRVSVMSADRSDRSQLHCLLKRARPRVNLQQARVILLIHFLSVSQAQAREVLSRSPVDVRRADKESVAVGLAPYDEPVARTSVLFPGPFRFGCSKAELLTRLRFRNEVPGDCFSYGLIAKLIPDSTHSDLAFTVLNLLVLTHRRRFACGSVQRLRHVQPARHRLTCMLAAPFSSRWFPSYVRHALGS